MSETHEEMNTEETRELDMRGLLEQALRYEADMAFRRRTLRLFEYLDPRGGERILDLGCGRGFHLQLLSQLFGSIAVGLDRDDEDLRRATENSNSSRILRGNAYALPFADNSFEKVLMTEVLEHLEHERGVLSEIHRVLRPEGVLAVSVPHAHYPFLWDPIGSIWTALGGRPIRKGPLVGIWTNHLRLYTPSELETVVRSAGFRVEEIEEATHYCFPFSHYLLYGIGKRLVDSEWAPSSFRKGVDRSGVCSERVRPSFFVRLGLGPLRWIDRFNESPRSKSKKTFVNVLLRARKLS